MYCYETTKTFGTYHVPGADRVGAEDFHELGLLIKTLRKLNHIGFWNAPEKLFATMAKLDLRFETLQFGQLNQSLTRLCSFDSIMQALFKFNQPKYDCYELHVSHLKMYLHAMPVVSLEYYLPHLMMGVNDALYSIKSFDLFVHCAFSATMRSSWMLDGRQKNSRLKFRCLTHFSLHIDGFCVFDDLDCHLPASLSSISISISLPSIGASKSVASLLNFIERLADVNAYPDLEELHLQVWGIRCAEILLNQVTDQLSDLRHLSVIAMPVGEERSRIIDLIRHVSSSCRRLVSLKFSTEMVKLLLDKYGDLWKNNWKLAITLLSKECQLRDSCELGVDDLPHTSGWDDYFLIPHYPKICEAQVFDFSPGCTPDYEKTLKSDSSLSEDLESSANDSFITEDDEVVPEQEEDELDYLEQQLESETERRHERYIRKKSRQLSTSSEAKKKTSEEEDEDIEGLKNPFIDDEASESLNGTESEDVSDAEPEDENPIFSSDEEMLEAAARAVNAQPSHNQGRMNRRRRIIVSDSD
ncbi:hypothetical protein KIN20_019218 [Parelaphostrongylus tenuis]|uniref:Uncharacterized protein n=1 Tax=Parelaphostrongylus tenuis TaxID=148309 RepID=A0AAD5MR96_PARTN|nr:hypothetical protein KIN20_019218 [Parelaphostrongylus tenuis]